MSVMDIVNGPDTPVTRGCIVEVVAQNHKDFGLKGEVVSINKLGGADCPRELFVIREGGSELVEEDYIVPYENEVKVVFTAAQRDYMARADSCVAKFENFRGREI